MFATCSSVSGISSSSIPTSDLSLSLTPIMIEPQAPLEKAQPVLAIAGEVGIFSLNSRVLPSGDARSFRIDMIYFPFSSVNLSVLRLNICARVFPDLLKSGRLLITKPFLPSFYSSSHFQIGFTTIVFPSTSSRSSSSSVSMSPLSSL